VAPDAIYPEAHFRVVSHERENPRT
jgi:hypothetical protein